MTHESPLAPTLDGGERVTEGLKQGSDEALFAGLRALLATTFPKRCANCGRTYVDEADYIGQTASVPGGASGLKQSRGDDDEVIVELFRNCLCGSTLMDCFADRRDASDVGLQRRTRLGELVDVLVTRGLDRQLARTELLKVLRGQPSTILRPHKKDEA